MNAVRRTPTSPARRARIAPGWIVQGLAAVLALALAPAAQANDSVAGMALGGLEFLRTDAIAMVEEELHITPDEVRVHYVFVNETEKPVDTLVAFPLPAVGYPYLDFDYIPLPVENDPNFVDFFTVIDGTPVEPMVEHRALLLGLDRTAILRELGVPLLPFDMDAPARIAALPPQTRAALQRELLISAVNEPLWSLQSVFYRRQTFAPGVPVTVVHSYRPVRGGSVSSPVGNSDVPRGTGDPDLAWIDAARERYCVEPQVEAAMLRQRSGASGWPEHHFGAADIGYILTTGGNWRGPIGRFRLVVEAPGPADFVFLCLEGARRVAQNRIEADIENFWPWHDLEILFALAWGEGMPGQD